MAVLIRKIILITALSISISTHALDNISVFCNIGQTLPLFSYNSSTKSENTFEIAKPADFAKSFSFGFDKNYKEKFSITFGILYREFEMNKSKFENLHKDDGFEVKSYIHHLRAHYNLSCHFGISKEINTGNFSTKPRLTLGYGAIKSNYSEIYIFNEENEMIHTKWYDYDIDESIVLGIGNDLDYVFFENQNFKIKLQFQTIFNWQAPKIKVYIRESDFASNSIN